MSTYIVPNVEGLWIDGWGVKRTMATNINVRELSTGKISYDIYTKTLTLKDVTLDCEYNDIGIRNDGINYLTIKLSGNNAINVNAQGINTNKITYIVGHGSPDYQLLLRRCHPHGLLGSLYQRLHARPRQ